MAEVICVSHCRAGLVAEGAVDELCRKLRLLVAAISSMEAVRRPPSRLRITG